MGILFTSRLDLLLLLKSVNTTLSMRFYSCGTFFYFHFFFLLLMVDPAEIASNLTSTSMDISNISVASVDHACEVLVGSAVQISTLVAVQPPIKLYAIPSTAPNFYSNIKYSSDGCLMIASSTDASFTIASQSTTPVRISSNESIYDYELYPWMNSDPQTQCFIATTRDHPVRLFDVSGRVRATYHTKDQADETKAPLTVRFSLDGTKIYCGFENSLQVFELSRPGTDCNLIPMTPNRKSKEGLKGLVSDICFNPDLSQLIAIASFSGQIGLMDGRTDDLLMLLDDVLGVTQVKFSTDGTLLFSASRAVEGIRAWDVRNTAQVLYTLPRKSSTNQRIYFDISTDSIVSGHEDGLVSMYDITTRQIITEYAAGSECIGACKFNPVDYKQIATVTGQRHFGNDEEIGNEKYDSGISIWNVEI